MKLWKRNNTPKPDSANPYLNARRSWNIHMGHVQQFGALGIFHWRCWPAYCAGRSRRSIAHIGSQSKTVPMVYEQDRAGNYVSLTRADRLPPAKIDDYRTAVWNFIDHIRLKLRQMVNCSVKPFCRLMRFCTRTIRQPPKRMNF